LDIFVFFCIIISKSVSCDLVDIDIYALFWTGIPEKFENWKGVFPKLGVCLGYVRTVNSLTFQRQC